MYAQSRSETANNNQSARGKKPVQRLPGSTRARQRGSVMVLVALALPVILGLAGLAVDMGRAYSVQRELVGAASAASMAGARCLYTACPSVATQQTGAPPYWAAAIAQANAAIPLNTTSIDGKPLSGGTITAGYYDTSSQTMKPYTALASSFIPTSTQVAAVQVNISTGGQNATLNTLFMQALPGAPKSITVSADGTFGSPSSSSSSSSTPSSVPTAGVPCVNAVGTSTVTPIAISKCMYDSYWITDASDGIAGPHPATDPSTGAAYDFHIGPQQVYHPSYVCHQQNGYNHSQDSQRWCEQQPNPSEDNFQQWNSSSTTCTSGGWTTFGSSSGSDSDTDTIKGFISSKNPSALKAQDSVYKSITTDSALYQAVNNCSQSGSQRNGSGFGTCEYVNIPILDTSASSSANSTSPITGFACVHVASADTNQQCVHTTFVALNDTTGQTQCKQQAASSSTTASSGGATSGGSCYMTGSPVKLQ
jgi:Flp pilus assembly protein TadG